MSAGIHSRSLYETPVAVIDFETTGLTAGWDRVIEVSVVRVEPGTEPCLVFDTLINPQRPVAATEIHGITDADVADAPCFGEVAGDLIEAIEGCVVAAYNVYFDIKFLDVEMMNAGVRHKSPHFCLMYMRPLLGLGGRCRLGEACRCHGVTYDGAHIAARDAMASSRLLTIYFDELRRRQMRTYEDLARQCTYKFTQSFKRDPFPSATQFGVARGGKLRSRSEFDGTLSTPPAPTIHNPIRIYWDELRAVLADLDTTEEELHLMIRLQTDLRIKREQIRVLHARAFASAITQFCEDVWLDDKEIAKLRRLHACLSALGWAPGE